MGAVLATQNAPTLDLLPSVRCINDNDRQVGTKDLAAVQSLVEAFVPESDASPTHKYLNGPLLSIGKPKGRRKHRNPQGAHDKQDHGLPTQPVAVATFVGDVTPWRPDKTLTRKPLRGEMDGTVAVAAGMYQSGRVVISSTHPEFEATADEWCSQSALNILAEMCLWAA